MNLIKPVEEKFLSQGIKLLGIDEVGRGCIAGPVYAACVSLDYDKLLNLPEDSFDLIRDSKQLHRKQRQKLLPIIAGVALECRVGIANVEEIENLGIQSAIFLAMRRALWQCEESYDLLLVDGKVRIPEINIRQETIVKGDQLCSAIAAASIVAKESRDLYMQSVASEFPSYGFENHVGYCTKDHLSALKKNGICHLHRRNFAPITEMIET